MRCRAVNIVALLGFASGLLASCGGREQVAFEDIETYDRPGVWPGGAAGDTGSPVSPAAPPGAAGMPYPTPAGGSVQPGITGVPLPPGSELLESFVSKGPLWAGNKGAVQVYAIQLEPNEILRFFDETLGEAGWEVSSSSAGPSGKRCDYVPNLWALGTGLAPDHWIIVTTEFVPRPGFEQDGDIPPGFREKGVAFAPRVPGKTTFSVITPR